MSSEDAASASYSDAHSSSSHGGDVTLSSNHSDEVTEPPPRQKPAWRMIRSESLYLALLFALVALVLPTLFSVVSSSSSLPETVETRKSPLAAVVPYIPTIGSVFHVSYSTIHALLQPFLTILSLIVALLAPLSLSLTILFKVFVLLPSKMVAELARVLYPVYLFCGVACLFGAGIGVGGRLLIEGSKLMFASPHDRTIVKKPK